MNRSNNVDRALLGASVLVWLAVIGVSVAAVVALVQLGTGRAGDATQDSGTPWALYVVIGVSAAIILASIPLLIRARRAAQHEPPPRRPVAAGRDVPIAANPTPVDTSTEKLRVFGSVVDPGAPRGERQPPSLRYPGDELVDGVWLRFTTAMATAIGGATLAVATATYCMAVGADGSAAALLAVAGIITVLMPAVPWWALRQLPA